jgi:hypothetical protein
VTLTLSKQKGTQKNRVAARRPCALARDSCDTRAHTAPRYPLFPGNHTGNQDRMTDPSALSVQSNDAEERDALAPDQGRALGGGKRTCCLMSPRTCMSACGIQYAPARTARPVKRSPEIWVTPILTHQFLALLHQSICCDNEINQPRGYEGHHHKRPSSCIMSPCSAATPCGGTSTGHGHGRRYGARMPMRHGASAGTTSPPPHLRLRVPLYRAYRHSGVGAQSARVLLRN